MLIASEEDVNQDPRSPCNSWVLLDPHNPTTGAGSSTGREKDRGVSGVFRPAVYQNLASSRVQRETLSRGTQWLGKQ